MSKRVASSASRQPTTFWRSSRARQAPRRTRRGAPSTYFSASLDIAPALAMALSFVIASFFITYFCIGFFMASVRFGQAPPETHHALPMGHSPMICPLQIVALGLPVLGGAVWAVRGLAPTQLRRAGPAAGGRAGGLGAVIYATPVMQPLSRS